MRERRLILEQQLSQLEAERESIGEAILEINRRLAVVDEVEGWNLLTELDDAFTITDRWSMTPKKVLNGLGSPLIRYSR